MHVRNQCKQQYVALHSKVEINKEEDRRKKKGSKFNAPFNFKCRQQMHTYLV